MAKKPRSDSKLDALTPEQKERLVEWLTVENINYGEARARVLEQFGVSTSQSALCAFFGSVAAPWKYARAKGAADQFAELMEGNFDAANIKRAKQLAFEALTDPRPNIEAASSLLRIIGDSAKLAIAQEKLALDARKVALLEKKAAQADAAKEITGDGSLTPEEKEARIKAVFGIH